MSGVHFPERRIEALEPRKSPYDIRNADLKGFGVRVLGCVPPCGAGVMAAFAGKTSTEQSRSSNSGGPQKLLEP